MKILLITDTHKMVGGTEKHFFQLKEELRKIKDLEVYSLGFSDKDEEGKDYKIIKETKHLIMRHFYRLFFNPAKYFEMRSYIKKINPDVIHLHNINKYTISLLKAIKGYKSIMTVHDYFLICPTQWNVHNDLSVCQTGFKLKCWAKHRRNWNWVIYLSQLLFFYKRNKLLKNTVKNYISPSPLLREYLIKSGFKNVSFIPHFVENKNTKPNFDKIKDNHLLYLGQLEENKGVHILVKEMKRVVDEIPGVKLKIAGKGSQEQMLRQLTKDLAIEKNVEFVGWIKDTTKLYDETSAVVVPSLWVEQFGFVTAEAMMHYRPVIGSDRGNTPWLVKNNINGFIVDISKKNELSDKIIKLLKNQTSIKKFGLAGRKRIIKLSNKTKIIGEMVNKYNLLK